MSQQCHSATASCQLAAAAPPHPVEATCRPISIQCQVAATLCVGPGVLALGGRRFKQRAQAGRVLGLGYSPTPQQHPRTPRRVQVLVFSDIWIDPPHLSPASSPYIDRAVLLLGSRLLLKHTHPALPTRVQPQPGFRLCQQATHSRDRPLLCGWRPETVTRPRSAGC